MRGDKGILHDIGVLALAQIAAQLLNVAALVYLARTVGSHWFGVLQFGVAFSAYALVVAEWGMWALGIREVARLDTPQAVLAYARNHLGLLLALAAATVALGSLLLTCLPLFHLDRWIFWLYLLSVVPQVFMLDWIGIGLEQMVWVGIVKTCRSLFYALLVLLLLRACDGWLGWPAQRWVPVMFLVGFVASNRLMARGVTRWLGDGVIPVWGGWPEWRRRLREAAPIGASNVVIRVVLGIDVILLGVMTSPDVVGNYTAAAKILFVLIVAVEVLWKAFLPRLARLWRDSPALFRARLSLYLGLVVAGFVPVAVGGFLLGGKLMAALYGSAFSGGGDVFRILSCAYVLLSLGMFFGNVLIASDRQSAYFAPLVASAVIAVVGQLLLVPRWQALGACWGMLAAHATLFGWTAWICRGLLMRRLWQPLAVTLGAAVLMAVVLHGLGHWHVYALVAAGAIVYALAAAPLLWIWARRMRALA